MRDGSVISVAAGYEQTAVNGTLIPQARGGSLCGLLTIAGRSRRKQTGRMPIKIPASARVSSSVWASGLRRFPIDRARRVLKQVVEKKCFFLLQRAREREGAVCLYVVGYVR